MKKNKERLNATNLICFGDNDHDFSMFKISDESYAPASAKNKLKEAANEVVGSTDIDRIVHFLKQSFSL